jgi:hypothetical protein
MGIEARRTLPIAHQISRPSAPLRPGLIAFAVRARKPLPRPFYAGSECFSVCSKHLLGTVRTLTEDRVAAVIWGCHSLCDSQIAGRP